MASGWLVRVEVDAGRGEVQPFVFAVAAEDFQQALELAKQAPEVVRPRASLGDRPPAIQRAELVHPVDARTIDKLELEPGELWNFDDPPLTDRSQFATPAPS